MCSAARLHPPGTSKQPSISKTVNQNSIAINFDIKSHIQYDTESVFYCASVIVGFALPCFCF